MLFRGKEELVPEIFCGTKDELNSLTIIGNNMFDFLEDVIDTALDVVTLGTLSSSDRNNVTNLLSTGLSIYEVSSMTGIALDIISELDE